MTVAQPSRPADVPLRERGNARRFAGKWARGGPLPGLEGLGCAVHVAAPGIVAGAGEYRFGEEIFPLRAGDLVGAPAGGKAHQLINRGGEELRWLGRSRMRSADAVEYPDSRKVAMAAGGKNADFKTATSVGTARLALADYCDGEDS